MIKMSFGLVALFLATSIQARHVVKDAPYVDYGGEHRISILNHCFEKGYIRPTHYINGERRLKKKVTTWELIDLGHNRTFNKIHYLKMTDFPVKYFNTDRNGDTLGGPIKIESFDIPECKESKIKAVANKFEERKATPIEVMVYGALHQRDISTIVDKGLKPRELDQIVRDNFSNRHELGFESPNCNNGYVNPYAFEFMDFSGDDYFLGGEGSGHGRLGGEGSGHGRYGGEGSGHGRIKGERVDIRLHMTRATMNELRFEPNWVERMLRVKPRYYRYLVEGDDIPESIVKVKCQEKN